MKAIEVISILEYVIEDLHEVFLEKNSENLYEVIYGVMQTCEHIVEKLRRENTDAQFEIRDKDIEILLSLLNNDYLPENKNETSHLQLVVDNTRDTSTES